MGKTHHGKGVRMTHRNDSPMGGGVGLVGTTHHVRLHPLQEMCLTCNPLDLEVMIFTILELFTWLTPSKSTQSSDHLGWEATRSVSGRGWEATRSVSGHGWEAVSGRGWEATRSVSGRGWEATRSVSGCWLS